MNKDKKPIIVGRMKSGPFRFHIEDDVYDRGGAVQTTDSHRLQAPGLCFRGERIWKFCR